MTIELKNITKTDYESGERGYYSLISKDGISHVDKEGDRVTIYEKAREGIRIAMASIDREAENDSYWIGKYYVHKLKCGDIKVYGVGHSITFVEDNNG